MPGANRYFSPVYVWHMAHRYQKQAFVLTLSRTRTRWRHGLFETKKHFGL
jgi:hypothetical protein